MAELLLVAAVACLVVGVPGVAFADAAVTGERVLAADVGVVTTGLVAAAGGVVAVIAAGTVLAA